MSFLGKLFGGKRENEPARPPAAAPGPAPERQSQPMMASFFPSGTRIANRYEVAGRPLVGGMGIVYLCLDHEDRRPVALKTFKPEFLPDRAARERFLEEGNTWVRLGRHPHIVHAYTVERIGDGREVYLVLELVAKEEGQRDASLRSWLTPGQSLPAEQALLITLQIVRGMRHAVATIPGFVHRDLKPENVLMGADRLSNAAINRVRVTDFGLVRGLRAEQAPMATTSDLAQGLSRLTRIGSVVGTPPYMAPEQWEGADVTLQADIYAVGCILGEMLSGRMLVPGGTLDALRRAHQGGQALASVPSTVPASLRELLAGCLAVEPGRRYRDWAVLEEDLAAACAHLAGQPAPEAGAATVLSRAERVAVGWSYNAMGVSYMDMGNARAALDYFERARQAGEAERERGLEAAGLTHLGAAYADLGDARRAIGYHERALAISREIGDHHIKGADLTNMGNAYANLGDARQAISYYEQALAIAREIGDRRGQGNALGSLGNACADLGEVRRALDYYEQALAIARETGDRRSEGAALGNLGNACADLGEVRRAIGYHEQALAIDREIGDRRGEGNDLGNLGSAYAELGDAQRAIGYYEQALAIHREIDDRRSEGADLSGLGNAYRELGDARPAIGYFEQALAIHREVGDRRSEGHNLGNLGTAYRQLGDARRAIGCYEQALVFAREIGDRQGEAVNLGNLGTAYGQLGDARRAIGYFEQALAIFREIGHANGVAYNSFNMALLYAQQGNHAAALPLAREAARLFGQMGHTAHAQRAQQLVQQLEGGQGPGPAPAQILEQFGPLIDDAVAAAHDDRRARSQVEKAFDQLTQNGWLIAEPIRRIWAGERDTAKLIAGLDESDSLIVSEILKRLWGERKERL